MVFIIYIIIIVFCLPYLVIKQWKAQVLKKKLLFIKSKRREFQTRFVNVVVDVVFVDGKILMFKGREFRVKDWVLIIAFKFCQRLHKRELFSWEALTEKNQQLYYSYCFISVNKLFMCVCLYYIYTLSILLKNIYLHEYRTRFKLHLRLLYSFTLFYLFSYFETSMYQVINTYLKI